MVREGEQLHVNTGASVGESGGEGCVGVVGAGSGDECAGIGLGVVG